MSAHDAMRAVERSKTAEDLIVHLAMLRSRQFRELAVGLRRQGTKLGERLAEQFAGAAETIDDLCTLVRPGREEASDAR